MKKIDKTPTRLESDLSTKSHEYFSNVQKIHYAQTWLNEYTLLMPQKSAFAVYKEKHFSKFKDLLTLLKELFCAVASNQGAMP